MSEAEGAPAGWERAYPYRDSLWFARYPLLDGRAGTRPLPPGVTPADALVRAQISAAYQLEALARAVMAGRQPAGVQLEKRHVLVDQRSTAYAIAAIWEADAISAEVQPLVDRALGCWRQVRARGVVVLEWDRPGYDDVTRYFDALLRHASDPEAVPVALEWVEAYTGDRPPANPYPYVPGPDPRAIGPAGALVLAVFVLPFVLALLDVPRSCRSRATTEADACARQLADLRATLLAPPPAGAPDDAAARAEALARLDAGDAVGAQALLDASAAWGVQMSGAQVLAYRVRCLPLP